MSLLEIKKFLINVHKRLFIFSSYSEIQKIRIELSEIIKSLEDE